MIDGKVLFDVLDVSRGWDCGVFEIIFMLVFTMPLILIALFSFRKAKTKSDKLIPTALGLVGLVSLMIGVVSLFSDPLVAEYRRDIETNDYDQIQGTISNLTESTILAGNPAATFEIAGRLFEYSRGSENYELNMVKKGSILENGLMVKIWFKGDKILKLLSMVERESVEPSNNQTPDIVTNAPNPDL